MVAQLPERAMQSVRDAGERLPSGHTSIGPVWLGRFAMGVMAGLTAQGILAFLRWLRAPALKRS